MLEGVKRVSAYESCRRRILPLMKMLMVLTKGAVSRKYVLVRRVECSKNSPSQMSLPTRLAELCAYLIWQYPTGNSSFILCHQNSWHSLVLRFLGRSFWFSIQPWLARIHRINSILASRINFCHKPLNFMERGSRSIGQTNLTTSTHCSPSVVRQTSLPNVTSPEALLVLSYDLNPWQKRLP
jgi:hypothetical protein